MNTTKNKVFKIGGVFPPSDIQKLETLGFDYVFTSGDSRDYIVNTIKQQEKNCGRRCA